MHADSIKPLVLYVTFLLWTQSALSFTGTCFVQPLIPSKNIKPLSPPQATQVTHSRIAHHTFRQVTRMSERFSDEVADKARMLYSGNDEDIQAQPSWNKLQMDFVLVRSYMKLDNRFQHSASRVKSLLSAVVEMGRVDLVAALLRMGAPVNDRDYAGRTALMVACSSEKYADWEKLVDLLLKAGADIQARDSSGDTALHMAQR